MLRRGKRAGLVVLDGMTFENSQAFRRLVDVFVAEAHTHGWEVSDSAAVRFLSAQVERGSLLLRIRPASVLKGYLDEDQVRSLARACIPVAAATGATGRDDEPPVAVPYELLGRIIANLGQAARFAASHGHELPESGLHNVVADACLIIGSAVSASNVPSALVPGYGLRLARRALYLVAAGIRSGWELMLDEPDGPETLADLTSRVVEDMEEVVEAISNLLPELPPLTVV